MRAASPAEAPAATKAAFRAVDLALLRGGHHWNTAAAQ